jgi:O-antigen ligase
VSPRDRNVLFALQGLMLGLPLLSGGNHPWALALACPLVLALLAVTLAERRRWGGGPPGTGLALLAGFVGLALATTIPLPPTWLARLAPATARLYTDMLGWSGDGEATWRPLALDPYGVWVEVSRLGIGFAVFAVLVAYPWENGSRGGDARTRVFGRLLLTLIAGSALLSLTGLLAEVTGTGLVMRSPSMPGRVSGPFVNPNHFAAWLEMVIPAAVAYLLALTVRLRRLLARTADGGRGTGVRARRAWIAALITHQQRLWAPLIAATAVLSMLVAHLGSGSRGGTAALLVGLGVTAAGIARRLRPASEQSVGRRWLPALLAAALVAASVGAVRLWVAADLEQEGGAADAGDPSLTSRLAVAAQGWGVVRDHPWVGTGLGSWLHAFRPYQAPPVEGGIWDHAHNDYLELAADSGVAGVCLAFLFALAVARAARGGRAARAAEAPRPRRRRHERQLPQGFEPSDWRAALAEGACLRWGLAGGVAAILVHSLVDFGLRMPANQLTLMVVLGLLVLSTRRRPAAPARALGFLLVLTAAAAVPQAANTALLLAGAPPLSPRDCLAEADLLLAEGGEEARPHALALVLRALDQSPADRAAHEALATTLWSTDDGEQALRNALALEPWSAELRDRLALRLWERGARSAAAAEIEESMFRFPYLVSHAYLAADAHTGTRDASELLRVLAEGDTMRVRLATLEAELADAVERGLTRALAEVQAGAVRASIVNDLVTLLEARGRWGDAADALRAEASRGAAGDYLVRAARDYLKARNQTSAEETLLAALLRTPEQGDLYRRLAVDIYAARGDFASAESVLAAGERNALDMRPVYEGVTEVLAKRERARSDGFNPPAAEPEATP